MSFKDSASIVWIAQSLNKESVTAHDDMEWVEDIELPTALISIIKFKSNKTWSEVRELCKGVYVRALKVPFFDDDEQTVVKCGETIADVLKVLANSPEWRLRVDKLQVAKSAASPSGAGKARALPRRR